MTTSAVNCVLDFAKFGHLAEICYRQTDGHSKAQTYTDTQTPTQTAC